MEDLLGAIAAYKSVRDWLFTRQEMIWPPEESGAIYCYARRLKRKVLKIAKESR
jgi:hypothetical protein